MQLRPRLAALALLVGCSSLLLGCHSTDGGGAGAHGPTASSSATQAAASSAPSGDAPAVASASPTPKPTVPSGEPGFLKLASGATLAMPAGATAAPMNNATNRLPGVVKAAYKYQLGDIKKLLLINEMDAEGLACKAVLDRELERANEARDDANEQRLAMRQMKGISEIKIGEHRALYAVTQNRAPTPGGGATDTSKPMLGVSTLIMCRGTDYIVMMHAAEQSAKPDDIKKMLVDIAASYKPAA